eukprot:TRINITY_DN8838_c1_g1_i1.p1 TRINITY_DN8838_c1_g1~~TRINITY_DN8838_c1_g1_i1.p1  ORF type:complete len:377 (+),score=112.60 TRINITY_DN8838_c1_g1_i1:103-1233(+)
MDFNGFEYFNKEIVERLSGVTGQVQPPKVEVEEPCSDEYMTVMLNGVMCFNVGFGEKVVKKGDFRKVQVNGDNNGLYLQVSVSTPFAVKGFIKVDLRFVGGNESREVFVGYLTAERGYLKTSIYLPFLPTTIDISTEYTSGEDDTDEINFTNDVIRYILKSPTLNPGLGSLPSAFTQNHAKHLPQYTSVITKKYNSSWHKYLKANSEHFAVFHFSEAECLVKGIYPYVKAHEVRVALASQTDVLEVDSRIARESEAHEKALTEHLKSVLDGMEEGMDQRDVMDHISQNDDFLYFVSPSISTLQRFLVKQRDTFVWTTHKDLPRCIGLARGSRMSELPSPQSKPVNNIQATKEPRSPPQQDALKTDPELMKLNISNW